MAKSQYTANAVIPVGESYDSANYILGETFPDNTVELIPKIGNSQFDVLQTTTAYNLLYKMYHVDRKRLLQWNGLKWVEVNDSTASKLVSNTINNQTIIELDDTVPPTAGQALVAVSSTKAVWSDVSSGGSTPPPVNASFVQLIGNGSSTTIVVTHNLHTESVLISVWEVTGNKQETDCTISIVNENAVALHFTHAPAINSLKVVIVSSIFSNAHHEHDPIAYPPQAGNSGKALLTDGENPYWGTVSQFSLPEQTNNTGKALFTDGTNPLWQDIPQQLPTQLGNANKFLRTDGTIVSWQNVPSPFPTQTGNEGKFLQTDGINVDWAIPNYMANPMSSFGDIVIGGTSGAAGRLGIGTADQILTVGSSGHPEWKSMIPAMAGNSGKVLSTDGSVTTWTTINEVPTVTGLDSGKILSNNGTSFLWITNTAPPDTSGQSGKYLTNNGSSTLWSTVREVPNTATHSGKILTNDGASSYWTLPNNIYPNQTNNSGKVLTTDGTNATWQFPASGFANPMTTKGDIITATDGGAGVRLARGTTGQLLTVQNDGTLAWETSTALTNPMTSIGDIITATTGGNPVRLGIGAAGTFLASNGSSPYWLTGALAPSVAGHSGQYLTNNGSATAWADIAAIPDQTNNSGKYLTTNGVTPSWSTIPSGFANPMTTLGDIIVAQNDGTASRLPAGTNGQILTVSSGSPAWTTITGLPTQTGHNGHFLTTNATTASWTQIYQVPLTTGNAGKFLGTLDGITYAWETLPNQLPSVSGQSGKYLSNDGNTALWVPYAGLPDLNGQSGKILSTDGVTAFWIDSSGAGGTGLTRLPITATSTTLSPSSPTAVLAYDLKTIDTTCKSFELYSISANYPCRIRLYGTYNAANADKLRNATNDPSGNHGLYTEVTLSSFQLSWTMSPIPTCFNMDTTVSTNIYAVIENMDSVNRAITVTLNILKLE